MQQPLRPRCMIYRIRFMVKCIVFSIIKPFLEILNGWYKASSAIFLVIKSIDSAYWILHSFIFAAIAIGWWLFSNYLSKLRYFFISFRNYRVDSCPIIAFFAACLTTLIRTSLHVNGYISSFKAHTHS